MGKKDKKDKKAVAVKRSKKETAPEVEVTVEVAESVGEDVAETAAKVATDLATGVVEDVPQDGISLLIETLDTLKDALPAVHEVCPCMGSITISDAVPEADRKRMHNAWLRRHKGHSEAVVFTDAEA